MRTRFVSMWWIIVSFVVVSCLLVGPQPTFSVPDKSPILIGMVAPLTGPGASFGISQKEGVLLALDEINKKGGIGGRKIEIVIEDSKTEPPTAVKAVNKLLFQYKVVALVGSAASLDVPAYINILDRAQVPQILPVAVLPAITESGSKWTFRNAMNDKIAAKKMAEFVVKELKARKVALLLEDSAFGNTGRIFGDEIAKLGVRPLTIETFKRGDNDITPQITKIKSLGATRIQFWGYYAEYALVAKQIKQLGMKVQLLGNQAPVNAKTIELGGDAVEGAMDVCLFAPTSKDKAAQEFVAKYRRKYNHIPDQWAAQSYDGMYILALAIKKGGSNPRKIRDALARTKDFKGVTGTITFNPKGDAEFRGTSIVVIHKGQFVPYKQYKSL